MLRYLFVYTSGIETTHTIEFGGRAVGDEFVGDAQMFDPCAVAVPCEKLRHRAADTAAYNTVLDRDDALELFADLV